MSPSRSTPVSRLARALPLAAALVFSLTSQSVASINWDGTLLMPVTGAAKYCSGAFRYAARDGNDDISPLSPVQAFANDRRFARTRYAARAMSGLEAERSRLHALNAMCG
jgi:hypothetical protein